MKSKILKNLFTVLFCLFVFLSTNPVKALEISFSTNIQWDVWNFKDSVPINKTWKINFNSSLDMDTIKEKNIYVTDSNGDIIPMFYTQNFGEDMSIYIMPVKNYDYDKIYTLWIKDLKSKNGQVLHKNVKMQFTTEQNTSNTKEVVVKNTKELLENIGPDKTIILKAGDYNLLEPMIYDNEYIEFEEVFDGFQLVINNVNNLTFKGESAGKVNLLIHPRYANVLNFRNCNNINISNVVAGHYPDEGYCTGGVLAFDDSKNINIDNSELFGCGTEGVTLHNIENFTFTNSIIKECSYGIMTLSNCKNIKFNNSQFHDNREFNLINLMECTDVEFNKCKIYNNRTDNNYYSYNYLFWIDEYSNVIVNECNIYDNKVNYLANTEENITFKNVNFSNNDFE